MGYMPFGRMIMMETTTVRTVSLLEEIEQYFKTGKMPEKKQ